MKGLLLFILSLSSLQGQEPSGFVVADPQVYTIGNPHEYETFINKLDQFDRKLGGCPLKGSTETCYPPKGIFDAKLWKDLCKRAQKIFKLLPAKE